MYSSRLRGRMRAARGCTRFSVSAADSLLLRTSKLVCFTVVLDVQQIIVGDCKAEHGRIQIRIDLAVEKFPVSALTVCADQQNGRQFGSAGTAIFKKQ